MKVNDELYIKTKMFEGWSTLKYIISGEQYGYQVELHEPDGDGHSVKRVARHEILEVREVN